MLFFVVLTCTFVYGALLDEEKTDRCNTLGLGLPGGFDGQNSYKNFEPSGLTYYPPTDSFVAVGDNGHVAIINRAGSMTQMYDHSFPDYLKNYTLTDLGLYYYDTDFEGVSFNAWVDSSNEIISIGVEWPPTIIHLNMTSGNYTGKYRIPEFAFGNATWKSGLESMTYVPFLVDHGEFSRTFLYTGSQLDGNIYIFEWNSFKYDYVSYIDIRNFLRSSTYITDIIDMNEDTYDVMIVCSLNELTGFLSEIITIVRLPEDDQEGIVILDHPGMTGYYDVFIAYDLDKNGQEIGVYLLNMNTGTFVKSCYVFDFVLFSLITFPSIAVGVSIIVCAIIIIIIILVFILNRFRKEKNIDSSEIEKGVKLNEVEFEKLKEDVISRKMSGKDLKGKLESESISLTTNQMFEIMETTQEPSSSVYEIPVNIEEEVVDSNLRRVINSLEKEECIIDKSKVSLLRVIASGAYGSVHLGSYKVGGAELPVAVKQMKINSQVSAEDVQKEIKIMTTIKNRHVLQCFGCYFDKGSAFIVMEYCNNGDLYDRKFKMKENMKYFALLQIAKGMNFLHQKKIVHRDLKSKNILIKGKCMKICDFGTSKTIGTLENSQTICGTPEYIAPEILSPSYDPKKTDIYAFGVLCWEIFACETPFQKELNKAAGNQFLLLQILQELIKNKRRPPMKNIKEKVCERMRNLMQKCWNEVPEDRPKNFDEIEKEIYEIIMEENKLRKEKREKKEETNSLQIPETLPKKVKLEEDEK